MSRIAENMPGMKFSLKSPGGKSRRPGLGCRRQRGILAIKPCKIQKCSKVAFL